MTENDTPWTEPFFWNWVGKNVKESPAKLILREKESGFEWIDCAVTQIECRKRFAKKLAVTLHKFPEFYFPTVLSGEQSTSDAIAAYHEKFVDEGDILVDLTAGLGIDVMHLCRKVKKATAIEKDSYLCKALEWNSKGLGIKNLDVINCDCKETLKTIEGTVVYIDPARRAANGSRVFGLSDCTPDITKILPDLKDRFNKLIIKTSPMLDISSLIVELQGTADVYAIGTATECKELVAIVDLSKDVPNKETKKLDDVRIHAVTIRPELKTVEFTFTMAEEKAASASLMASRPKIGDILYEPFPSTMKAQPVKLLSERFNVKKFHINTHLYFGKPENIRYDFPGKLYEIVDLIVWQSKNLKRFKSKYPNVMVSVRNFGMTADALRAKLGVKENGSDRLRLFGIGLGKDHTDKLLVVCKEVNNEPE